MRRLLTAILLLPGASPMAHAQSPELSLPVACQMGKDCFIQQYFDVQPGPGAKDYRCGAATYEGHSGTDLRLLSVKAVQAGVPVLAAAAGRVKGRRDEMEDRLSLTDEDRKAIANRECGNGVVIDHGGGWETQYCHMRRGSVTVRNGEAVAAGTRLSLVGFSGNAAFAHLHLSVRHDGRDVDPFLGAAAVDGTCQADASQAAGLWSASLREQLAYRGSVIIQTGFSDKPVGLADMEQGVLNKPLPGSPALVFYARLINLLPGDRLRFSVEGPDGFKSTNETEPVNAAKAHYVAYAGKKLTGARWPEGVYEGSVELVRDRNAIRKAKATFRIQ